MFDLSDVFAACQYLSIIIIMETILNIHKCIFFFFHHLIVDLLIFTKWICVFLHFLLVLYCLSLIVLIATRYRLRVYRLFIFQVWSHLTISKFDANKDVHLIQGLQIIYWYLDGYEWAGYLLKTSTVLPQLIDFEMAAVLKIACFEIFFPRYFKFMCI